MIAFHLCPTTQMIFNFNQLKSNDAKSIRQQSPEFGIMIRESVLNFNFIQRTQLLLKN